MSIDSVSSDGWYANNVGNDVDKAYHLMHVVERRNRAMQDPVVQAFKAELIQKIKESLTLRATDTTDERIVKISTIIGTFVGGVGGVAGAPFTNGLSLAAIPVGYGLGWGTGHGIVKVKHVVQDKCLIL